MKKIILFTGLFIFVFSFNVVLATSGTCSSHDGVNCSAGSDWDGSAICNDGWRDSSESYYSVSKCSDYKPVCTSEERQELMRKSGIDNIRAEIQSLEQQYNEKKAEKDKKIAEILGGFGIQDFLNSRVASIERSYSPQLIYISNTQKSKLWNIQQLQKNIEDECYYLGKQRANRKYDEMITSMKEQLLSSSKDSSLSQDTSLSCSINSHLSTTDKTKCTCDTGYQLNSTKDGCILIPKKTNDQVCKEDFGSKSGYDGTTNKDGTFNCKCINGYVMSKNKKCISMANWCIEIYGKNIHLEGELCTCDNGYFFDDTSKICKKITDNETSINQLQNQDISTQENKIETLTEPQLTRKSKWYKRMFNWFF